MSKPVNPVADKGRKRIKKVLLGLFAALLVFLSLLLYVAYVAKVALDDVYGDEYELFRSVKIGMTEEEVVQLLGQTYNGDKLQQGARFALLDGSV